jgi:hypothetical protein
MSADPLEMLDDSGDDLEPDSSDPNLGPGASDRVQQRKDRRLKDLLEMRGDRAITKRRIHRVSRLARYRADLVVLRQIGASYGEIKVWLKKKKRVTVSTSTVIRYLAGLPELRKKSVENDE